jgi:transcriptional regulator with XRE-family HTH domain
VSIEVKIPGPADVSARVSLYLGGIAKYLAAYRAREELTQSEMATRLGLSLNRYREYEQNTTDNSKGIPLDLLLRITSLEEIPLPEFLTQMDGAAAASAANPVDELEDRLLACWREVPLEDRRTFVRLVVAQGSGPTSGDEAQEEEPLIPQKMRWIIRVSNLLGQLPYDVRMKFEREVLEEYMAIKKPEAGTAEHDLLLDRLRELIRHYYTNFEGYRK